MNDFEKKLYEELLEDLAVYSVLGAPPVRRLTGALSCVCEAITTLKKHIKETDFENNAEEIAFFKYSKPAFLAEQFYAMEIFHVESTRPLNDIAALDAFYGQELKYVQRFFEQHKFLYAYYQGDMTELDKLLFLRGARPFDIPLPDMIDADEGFSTSGDRLFAKFRAFERMRDYLLAKLRCAPASVNLSRTLLAQWPGEKTDLVELGYGLYAWFRSRKSKVTAGQLMGWLEESFGVKVGRPHQRLSEIKLRKLLSRTRFLDELREVLTTYMEDGDAWIPGN